MVVFAKLNAEVEEGKNCFIMYRGNSRDQFVYAIEKNESSYRMDSYLKLS